MSEDNKISYRWKSIEDIPKKSIKALTSPELKTLANIWQEHAQELGNSQVLKRFNERLARHWAIETGIIEGLYKIDRGITDLLIEKGIESALIPHGTTDKPAEEIVMILKDHQNVLEGLFDFVASRRPLSASYIKEVHQALCEHQLFVEAKNSQGKFMNVPLKKGAWKLLPNNPYRPDGLIHEYCPPEQVASEMDRLIEMHLKNLDEGIPPEIEAAWLHHRFSQIHPFQDGNGRVARALATLILLRARLFPFTVDRTERENYISCLENADNGDLGPFTEMIARAQRGALTKALSLSEGLLSDEKDFDALILASTQRLKEKKEMRQTNLEKVFDLSTELEDSAFLQMEEVALQIRESLRSVDPNFDCNVIKSGPITEHWFYTQVVETAKKLEYYADLRRYHHWVRLRISESQISSVIISFHPLGTVFRGIMVVSAFYEERSRGADDDHSGVPVPKPVISEVFKFFFSEKFDDAKLRFEKWLHQALLVALTQWRKSM